MGQCSKLNTLVGHINSMGEYAYWGARKTREISVPAPHMCCENKIALRIPTLCSLSLSLTHTHTQVFFFTSYFCKYIYIFIYIDRM